MVITGSGGMPSRSSLGGALGMRTGLSSLLVSMGLPVEHRGAVCPHGFFMASVGILAGDGVDGVNNGTNPNRHHTKDEVEDGLEGLSAKQHGQRREDNG